MAGKLQGQTIWITGASSGVGEGMATVFHRAGAELILSARREAELERVRADCTGGPGQVHILPFDIVFQGSLSDLSMGAFPRMRKPRETPDAFLYR